MIGTKALLDQPELSIKISGFALHQGGLGFSQTANRLAFAFDELVFPRPGDDRYRIVRRVAVHCHHHLGCSNLAHWFEFSQFLERVQWYMLVAQQVGNLWADARKQISLFPNKCHVDVQSAGKPLFGNPLLDRIQDHLVFLNHCEPAYATIVSECFVLGGNEAYHLALLSFAKDIDAQMPIQQMKLAGFKMITNHYRRLDDPDLSDRCYDLSIFGRFADRARHFAQGEDVGYGNAQRRMFKGERYWLGGF